MAHYQYPHQPHPGAVELDTSNSSRYDGEVFEMPGDSAVPKPEREQQQGRRPVQAQDEELGGMQANPWPFYLDRDVGTEASSRRGDAEDESNVGAREDVQKGEVMGKGVDGKAERPLANPWAYFGPMSPSEDVGGREAAAAAGQHVGGLGTRIEGAGDVKAKSESQDAPAAAPAAHQGTHGEQGANGASPSPPVAPTGEPSPSSPPAPGFYPAPLRLSRKDVPPAAAPAFKPYAPPTDSVPAVAPLNVKHQRPSPDVAQGEAPTTLPYRPYRPAGHGEQDVNQSADAAAASSAPVMPPQPAPAQSHGPPVTAAVVPQGTSPQVTTWSASGSPNPAQQQPAPTSPDGLAPHHPSYQPSRPPPPAATGPPSPLPVAAPPVPPHPPLSPHPPAAAAAAAAAAPPPPHPIQAPTPAAPPHPSVPAPSPYPHTPHHIASVQPVSPYHHTSPSPSPQRPATGYPPSSSPVPGLQPYGLPHSAPNSSLPSPAIVPFQFQPTTQSPPQNLYPVPTPTPPVASYTPPAPIPSPGPVSYHPPPQHYTPPPPTSSYDIPQPTYAASAEIPPPQPPRPQLQQATMGAYQYHPQPHPQPSPQAQPPFYDYAGTPSPVAQPPVSPQPSPYHNPYGPAIAPHQHHYPAQPTYAASNANSPSSPDPQGQYAVPPLPPRPATAQPQLFAGFTSQNVVVFPPPPKRVFSPPPVAAGAAPPPPRRQSGGSGGRLFSSSSALKWIDKTGKGLENKLDAVLGSQGSSKPPPQPPRPT
ncbi:hypothetical protein CCMA1212_007114 [Trichoderma ghanense]|uniref:Uncharacterized protein n=1 Tax=Trichoderma ghanense TaxID=65468 RepID=A0ABY2GXV8_9HYPO